MFPLPERRRSHHEGSPRYQTDLLQKGQVVFQMPVVGDATTGHAVQIDGLHIDDLRPQAGTGAVKLMSRTTISEVPYSWMPFPRFW